jgi:hypothetical protein
MTTIGSIVFNEDKTVPADEVWFLRGNDVVGKIININNESEYQRGVADERKRCVEIVEGYMTKANLAARHDDYDFGRVILEAIERGEKED